MIFYQNNVIICQKGVIFMKKKDILNLIKFYSEDNDVAFKNQAYDIASEFDSNGDTELAQYIMATLADKNSFIPQGNTIDLSFLSEVYVDNNDLYLPDAIKDDIFGILNAVNNNKLNKFLFFGEPGTGKTESVKFMSRVLKKKLYIVDFEELISSLLGETSKNIKKLFQEINSISNDDVIVLFDEIDEIALNRISNNDTREMGRATTSIIRGLDMLNSNVLLIATTNLKDNFDKALLRRFNSTIDFNRYSKKDLKEIATTMIDKEIKSSNYLGKDMRLFSKIMDLCKKIPYPGDLKNILVSAAAFTDESDKYGYLRRIYNSFVGVNDINFMKDNGFTLREMSIITKKSTSTLSRELKEN